MKNKVLNIALALMVTFTGLVSVSNIAKAETSKAAWEVTYTGTELVSNHDATEAAKTVAGTMPGDTITYEVTYTNKSEKTADFYMASNIIATLEETKGSNAAGGAYSYSISYDAGQGQVSIYDTATLGGDIASDSNYAVGLKQAASTNDTYFYVGQLKPDASGKVYVTVSLDGNTQDNSYMTTLAELGIYFGVEETAIKNKQIIYTLPGGEKIIYIKDDLVALAGPKTGDSILPLVLCSVALVLGLLLIAFYFRMTKKNEEEVA